MSTMNNDTSALAVHKSHAFLMEALSPQQRIYVESRALGSVPVVAARVAGFPDPDYTALEIERDPTVRLAVEAAIRMRAHQTRVTRLDVENGLLDAVRMAENSTELRAAWRELGLLGGHYDQTKKVEVEVKQSSEQLQKQMKSAPDGELARMAVIEGEYEILDFEEEETGAVARLDP